MEESSEFSQRLVSELKAARIACGLSKYALAKKAGVSQTMVYHLEKGDRNPTIVTAHALAKAMDLDFAELARKAAELRI